MRVFRNLPNIIVLLVLSGLSGCGWFSLMPTEDKYIQSIDGVPRLVPKSSVPALRTGGLAKLVEPSRLGVAHPTTIDGLEIYFGGFAYREDHLYVDPGTHLVSYQEAIFENGRIVGGVRKCRLSFEAGKSYTHSKLRKMLADEGCNVCFRNCAFSLVLLTRDGKIGLFETSKIDDFDASEYAMLDLLDGSQRLATIGGTDVTGWSPPPTEDMLLYVHKDSVLYIRPGYHTVTYWNTWLCPKCQVRQLLTTDECKLFFEAGWIYSPRTVIGMLRAQGCTFYDRSP